ncbi:MAG: hypothetical protein CMN77_16155 [Spirochaetaceae bacterium]|nr:hypothetical protein [Spirochaetaceae bacterium]
MSENQNTSAPDRGEGSGLFDAMAPDVALKTLSNLQLEDSRIMAPLKNRSRLANQIYDLVQSFLTGARSSKDVYYPSLADIYGDLQMHKRAISDKSPMPSEAELLRTVCLMSVQSPPFLHILRELKTNATSPDQFITRLVAPTEKHPDKVAVAYRSTTRNNLVYIKGLIRDLDPALPGGPAFHKIQDANPRAGRVETILGKLFISSMAGDETGQKTEEGEDDQSDELTLKRVNQSLRIKLFRPLIMDLLREKIIFSLSCQDLRNQTGQKIPDIVLFNILENIKHRFSRLVEILTHSAVQDMVDQQTKHQMHRFQQSGHTEDAGETAAHYILENARNSDTIPAYLIEIAAEAVRLRQWYDEKARENKKDQQKQELQVILQKLKNHKGIFRAKNGRKIHIEEKYLSLFLNENNSPVLVAADPPLARSGTREPADYETIYLLFKDRAITGQAIQTALEAYNKTQDTFLIGILQEMLQINSRPDSELKQFVPPAYLEQLREAIRDSYKSYLSPFERFWLAITGKRISDAKISRIQKRLEMERGEKERSHSEKKSKARTQQARKDVKTLARQRSSSEGSALSELATEKESTAGFDHAAQEVLNYLLTQVNSMWDKNFYPDRDQVLRLASNDQKEIAQKVLGLVDAGAQSTASMMRIAVPGKGYIYAGHDYVHGHKKELIQRFKSKLDQASGVQVGGGTTIQLNTKEEDKHFFRAILQYLNHLPDQ